MTWCQKKQRLTHYMLRAPGNTCDVALLQCKEYSRPIIKRKLASLLNAVSYSVPPGSKILLKPNLVIGNGLNSLACTNGQFIAAVAEWFLDHGTSVAVGDSPAFGSAIDVMEKTGISAILKKLPVTLIDFKAKRVIPLGSGGTAAVAAEIFEYDQLINLPKLKAHSQMRLSLAVKNVFGSVVGCRKAIAHMRHGNRENLFPALIVDLIPELPIGVNILDGVIGMHKNGPVTGVPHSSGIIGASKDPVALDTALLALLGIPGASSPLWQECHRRNLSGANMENINFPLLTPEELAITSFIVPEILAPIRFKLMNFLENGVIKAIKLCKKKVNAGM